MFGSLVITFPTPHEGGALTLRHCGKEWSFDSGELSGRSQPSVSYVAFYSDVEHEVELVKSGYHITLTYNLYFAPEKPADNIIPTLPSSQLAFKNALLDLLADSSVFPDGGHLGFGLRHEYPVNSSTDFTKLMGCLKGSDAFIFKICSQLSLKASLKVVYKEVDEWADKCVMVNHVVELDDEPMENGFVAVLEDQYDGRVVHSLGQPAPEDCDLPVEVYWVTKMTTFTIEDKFVAWGNEPSMGHCYGNICLIVRVGPANERIEK